MIFRNSVAQSGAMITGYLFSFILAPIMLSRLGLAQFGVWAVTGAFATYAGLMDLGITRALERFVAFYHANGDRRSVEQCFGLGLIAVTVVAAIAGVVAFAAAAPLAHVLDDVLTVDEMRVVLLSSASIMALNAYRSVMRAVPHGMQQMVLPSFAMIAGNVINFAFSLVALILSRDLVVYALANVAATVVSLIPMAIALRRTWSPVRAHVPPRSIVNEVLGFSLKSQVAWIADLVNNQTDKIIIALFIDVRAAGAYEIANRVVLALKAVAVMGISALTSASTARLVEEGRGMVARFYPHYTRRSLSVSLPMLIFACVAAPALMVAWLGDVPNDAVAIVVVLTLANAVNLSTGVATTVSLGDGRAGMIANNALLVMALNIAATLILTPLLGLWGVLAGTAIAIVLGSARFLRGFHGLYGLRASSYFRAAGPPAALALLAGIPILLWELLGLTPVSDRLPAFALTFAYLAVYVAIYWPLASHMRMLPDRLNLFKSRPATVAT